ncbi:MAG: hypothetical protein AAGD25_27455 [Cyanobacteria bacterium P01_F01_bin.150]
MEKENIVRTIETLITALALTLALGILAPVQDVSARHSNPQIYEMEQQLLSIRHYVVEL